LDLALPNWRGATWSEVRNSSPEAASASSVPPKGQPSVRPSARKGRTHLSIHEPTHTPKLSATSRLSLQVVFDALLFSGSPAKGLKQDQQPKFDHIVMAIQYKTITKLFPYD
jgi:hypothetical protein